MLIDSHAHITNEYYDDINLVIKDAKKNNVLKVINCSTSLNDIEEIAKISNDYDINYAIGIHPTQHPTMQRGFQDDIPRFDDVQHVTLHLWVVHSDELLVEGYRQG